MHNNLRRETSADRLRAHGPGTVPPPQQNGRVATGGNFDDSEERLARFTEYRGGHEENGDSPRAAAGVHRRGSSVAYDSARRHHQQQQQQQGDQV